tara:strand:- start:2467 stop:2826 length:360 start_codon:yes stop_codon:yes gene_type:complete
VDDQTPINVDPESVQPNSLGETFFSHQFAPAKGRIIVMRDSVCDTYPNGLKVPEQMVYVPNTGTVLAIGFGCDALVQDFISVGDRVAFFQHAGIETECRDGIVLNMDQCEVIAKIRKAE